MLRKVIRAVKESTTKHITPMPLLLLLKLFEPNYVSLPIDVTMPTNWTLETRLSYQIWKKRFICLFLSDFENILKKPV